MNPIKSIKSRYAITPVNSNNYMNIPILSGLTNSGQPGLIFVPYIMDSHGSPIIEELLILSSIKRKILKKKLQKIKNCKANIIKK